MPICYMIGKLKTDKTGKLINIDFVSENHETSKLIAKNTDTEEQNSFFDMEYIIGLLDNVRKRKRISSLHITLQKQAHIMIFLCVRH